MGLPENPNIFANNPLDRASYRRTDKEWLATQLADSASLVVPFFKNSPFVLPEAKPGEGKDIGWVKLPLLKELGLNDPLIVFLGINKRGKALFAADISSVKDPEQHAALKGLGGFEDLASLANQGSITPTELAIMAQAKSMLDWHNRHQFCSVCGAKSTLADAGYKRQCSSCKAEHFPRTDPVVIMLPTHGDKCFLGRQKAWPKGMYSALAGFVEPGESIEEAVAREIDEEASIKVSRVSYHSTQPWPYPSSLMIGCMAEADSDAFEIDGIELSDGRWFTRDEARDILAGKSVSGDSFPPAMAIAFHLITAFTKQG
jgi:NAD+ diphosphatase